MADSIPAWCRALEESALGVLVRESLWGFPILVSVHIMGLVFSVGFLVWFDLRLLGLGLTGSRVSAVYRRLSPWMAVGFASMVVTGVVLFTGYAPAAYNNLYFRIKVAAIALAAVNALFFHFVTERDLLRWDGFAQPPPAARLAGLVSISLWTIVILCGRMMSYTMFSPGG